ncbi:protein-disulfide reductase DsbD family protein [Ramlibacter rhizophilus]|uniref:Protein-disulfide reductase n=1 Tax=Ramlibacter rhizophilus TaxID=1781167 RepID=A0A4Z0BCA1_9BURK|nr:thioredoxin family protein [Ramlibacter rhizophilus]TFY96271.1 protein-disulfide reductase [Ramlibacter rhizophilus]
MSFAPLLRLVSMLLVALALSPSGAFAQLATGSAQVVTERVRAELLAHAPEGVAPGKPVWLGLQLAHQPEWHTYWKNSGDSGLPTTLEWTLPPGVVAGDIAWPVPKKIPIGNLANYGYEGTVLLPVPLTITPEFRPPLLGGNLDVKLKAQWLVCKKECIPEEGEFALKLPVQGSTGLHGANFQAAFDAQPQALPTSGSARVEGQTLKLEVPGLPAAARGQSLEAFPETPGVIETAAAWRQGWRGETWTAEIPLATHLGATPAQLPVVLASGDKAWRVDLPVAGTWPAASAAAAVSPGLEQALRANAAAAAVPAGGANLSLWAALLGALVGGLILNLMPCVFPVLAVKLVGFTRHGLDRRARRVGGLAYAAGVVLSFLALGALMLALRAAGEQLGWGFQLQSPWVVAGLAALFTLIGLNLAGVFEFGALLPSRVSSFQLRHPVADAFLSGMLAVAIASPCTAPFMGASLGFAVAMPPAQALLVFAALGLGMALPYLLASWVPATARLLPRPGAWMDTFRKLMAFPMFATVAWLVWVLGRQSGVDGAGALLALLVALSLVTWTLTLAGRTRVVLASLGLAAFGLLAWVAAPQLASPAPDAPALAADGRWEPWSAERVATLVAQDRPVFVDFTAAWCVTCQYNKQTTLANREVLADFEARRVSLLRADWTRRDPAITQALSDLGRSGVPVYVLYAKGRAPVVLSEILSTNELRAALAAL